MKKKVHLYADISINIVTLIFILQIFQLTKYGKFCSVRNHIKFVCMVSRFSFVQLFVTLWTVAHQASLYMEFSRQEYRSRLPCPPPGDLPNPGMEPTSLMIGRWFLYHYCRLGEIILFGVKRTRILSLLSAQNVSAFCPWVGQFSFVFDTERGIACRFSRARGLPPPPPVMYKAQLCLKSCFTF